MCRNFIRIFVLPVVLCLPLALGLSGAPAWAHAIIVTATPAAGSAVTGPDIDLVLVYNVRVDAARSKLTLSRPDGGSEEIAIDAISAPEKLTGKAHNLTAGDYVLHWQVLATDGHITRGDVPFSVTP